MTVRMSSRIGLVALATLALLGCGLGDDVDSSARHQAVALEDQADPVCGMFVREQSAPRSQLVHRDGSRFFLCSLGDMLVHLDAPSPHGKAEAVFVEVMQTAEDPAQSHTGEHAWLPAEEAAYVVGIERRAIMGEPVLAYASRNEAEAAMKMYGGTALLDLPGLQDWWQATQAAK